MNTRFDKIPNIDLSPDHWRTTKAKEIFASNGFLKATQLIEPHELAALKKPYFQVMKDKIRGRDPLKIGIERSSFLYILQPELHSLEFANNPALQTIFDRAISIASHLCDIPESDLHVTSSIFFKPPFHGKAIPWHQDAFYEQISILSFWFSFDPSFEESGAIRYLPGSHKGAVQPHVLNTDDPVRSAFMVKNVEESKSILCPTIPGDLLIHHPKVLHCSGPNSTANPRAALVMRCKVKTGEA